MRWRSESFWRGIIGLRRIGGKGFGGREVGKDLRSGRRGGKQRVRCLSSGPGCLCRMKRGDNNSESFSIASYRSDSYCKYSAVILSHHLQNSLACPVPRSPSPSSSGLLNASNKSSLGDGCTLPHGTTYPPLLSIVNCSASPAHSSVYAPILASYSSGYAAHFIHLACRNRFVLRFPGFCVTLRMPSPPTLRASSEARNQLPTFEVT